MRFDDRMLLKSQDQLVAEESIRAEEDRRIFAIMDEIARPCSRCGLTSFSSPVGDDGLHASQDVCDLVLAGAILES